MTGATSRKRKRRRRSSDSVAEQHLWKASLLRTFLAKHGWSKLARGTIVAPGVNLFNWVATRHQYRTGDFAKWLVDECESIKGWSCAPLEDAMRRHLDLLKVFVRKHGWDALTPSIEVESVRLHKWVAHRRAEYRRGTLHRRLVAALQAIPGWSWVPRTADKARNLRELVGMLRATDGRASTKTRSVGRGLGSGSGSTTSARSIGRGCCRGG